MQRHTSIFRSATIRIFANDLQKAVRKVRKFPNGEDFGQKSPNFPFSVKTMFSL